MITDEYINFTYNKCYIETIITPTGVIKNIEMPNGFALSVYDTTEENIILKAKSKIRELESYLQRDKEHYGYDLEGEYE